jgi:hypothetical protein
LATLDSPYSRLENPNLELLILRVIPGTEVVEMELTGALANTWMETARKLQGAQRRLLMAQTVRALGAALTNTYQKRVRLPHKEMKLIEAQVQRWPGLEKWFVDIPGYCTVE